MLIKLMKHEIIASYRSYLPIYIALYALSFLLYITNQSSTDSLFVLFLGLFLLLLGAMSLFIIYNLIISLGSRVYGKPGYLLFSVPAKTWEIMLSKFIINFMWVIVSLFVTVTSFQLAFGLLGVWDEFVNQISYVWEILGFSIHEVWSFVFYAITYVAYLIMFFMFLFTLLNVIYKGEKKILFGVLLYIGLDFVTGLVTNAVTNAYASTYMTTEAAMNYVFFMTFYYLALAIVFGGLNYYLMSKKLELQ